MLATQDRIIQQDVVDSLNGDVSAKSAHVHVSVTDRHVTLAGTVATQLAHRSMVRKVWAVPGVLAIVDKLALAISSIEDPSDSRIEQNKPRVPSANSDVDSSDPDQDIWERVTGALAQTDCRELDPCAIEVVVNNGTVTLEGIVPSWAAMRAALDAARQTPGIRLRNGILLSP